MSLLSGWGFLFVYFAGSIYKTLQCQVIERCKVEIKYFKRPQIWFRIERIWPRGERLSLYGFGQNVLSPLEEERGEDRLAGGGVKIERKK